MGENEPALINTVITIHNVHGVLGYNKHLAIQCQQLLFSSSRTHEGNALSQTLLVACVYM